MAALEWNEWQLSSGFGGSFGLEYAEKRYQTESEAIRSRFEEYRQWIHETMNTEDQPYIQVVAAIVNQ